jgi:hypothetical protein
MINKTLYHGKVRYWALVFSVAAHAATLAVFTGVKMSGRMDAEPAPPPALNVQMIEHVVAQPMPKPKPRIEPISKPVVRPEPEQQPLIAEPKTPEPVKAPESVESMIDEAAPVANEVEFFGQKSIVQRICYVVDCSGSMYGQMYQVKDQLKTSILKLNSQQAFCVVFFMEGQKILTTGDGMLQPATAQEKSKAIKLIDSVRPSGSTDAEHALQQALQLKDAEGGQPEVIYFLTDGFDLDSQHSARFVESVDHLRKSLAPAAVLHTIGFWPQPLDRQMLRRLAGNANGEFIEIN